MIRLGVFGVMVGIAAHAYGSADVAPIVQHEPAARLVLPDAALAQATGATATLLANGTWLLLGGQDVAGQEQTAAARLYDAALHTILPLPTGLAHARAFHTATLLADGRVLVLGGTAQGGGLVSTAEFYDPGPQTLMPAADLGLTVRAHHRATVLADGRVLLTGGSDAQGHTLDTAELWNPFTLQVENVQHGLTPARQQHLAALLPNHSVLLWGGRDQAGVGVGSAELYDPDTRQFAAYDATAVARTLAELQNSAPPVMVDSLPDDGAHEVPVSTLLSVRFSKPLQVTSLQAQSIALLGPEGHVPTTITPTEGGLVLFVLPQKELLPQAHYTLLLHGAMDHHGQPLPFTTIAFTTSTLEDSTPGAGTRPPPGTGTSPSHGTSTGRRAGPAGDNVTSDPGDSAYPAVELVITTGGAASTTAGQSRSGTVPTPLHDDESFGPGAEQQHGHWRTGRPLPDAVTALLDFQEPFRQRIERLRARMPRDHTQQSESASATRPVDDPTITGLGGTVLRLNDKPLPGATVSIGTTSVRTDAKGRFELRDLAPGHYELTVDGRTAGEYLHVIMGVDIRSQGFTELTHAVYLPRLRSTDWFEVPSPTPGATVVKHADFPAVEALRIPKGTVFRDRQGKILNRVALVPVPLDRSPYPTPAAFPVYFMLHPGGVRIEGVNTRGIRTVYANSADQPPGTEHLLWFYDAREAGWTVYGKGHVSHDGKVIEPEASIGLHEHMGAGHSLPPGKAVPEQAPPPGGCTKDGDPVDCSTGLFQHERTDVVLADDLPLQLTRSYRPGDAVVRAFGRGTNYSYGIYLRSPSSTSYNMMQLILPDGGRIALPRTGGTDLHTNYVWTHTATPTVFYGARLTAPADAAGEHWDLWLKDGTLYVFDLSGELSKIVDRYGNGLFFTRNGGRIVRITTHNGRTLDFSYDAVGRITRLKDLLGRTWRYAYNAAGYLSMATYPDTTFEEYTYNATGLMLTVKDRRGTIMVTNEYDANGRVIQQTLADGGIFLFSYTLDANGKVTQTDVTDPRGAVRRRLFNAAGYLSSDITALGRPEEQTMTYERNAAHLLIKRTDALGRVTAFEYDAKGNVAKVTRLFGTPNAVSWTYTYEPLFQQLASITDPLQHTVHVIYDTQGKPARIEDDLGNHVALGYDGAGHLRTQTRYADGTALTTSFAYDGSDLVEVRDPLDRTMALTPDILGRVVGVRDPLGRYARTIYDVLGRPVQETDAQGLMMRYAYDGNSNLLSVTAIGAGMPQQVTRFSYDARNRLVRKTDPLLKDETYAYDRGDNLLFMTDRKGQVTGYQYDALSRRIQAGFGASSTSSPVYTSTILYAYDDANRLRTVQDSLAGTIAWSYDNRFDTVTQETSPQGTVDYSYYPNGLRMRMVPSGGTAVLYNYDAANRLTDMTQAAGPGGGAVPGAAQTVRFAYDSAHRPTQLTLPNGITLDYGYDAASQLQSILYKRADSTTLGDLTYSYDAVGQRLAINGSFSRTGLPQPMPAAQYDANNRLIQRDSVTYTYDDNGNLLSDGTSTYTWNARNQLVALSGPENATFAYDGLGRRIQVIRNGQTTAPLYDGWNPIQLKDSSTVLENRLVGPGLDQTYVRTRAGQVESFLTDALGSTMDLRSSSAVQTVAYTYDPYGSTTESTASTNIAKYTGREQDFADLYYYRHRYYKPSIGRFISEDPIGLAGGMNVYSYARNNPLKFTDPKGLDADCDYYTGRCKEDGGPYYCKVAPQLCQNWPDIDPPGSDANWVDCVRKCLQSMDPMCDPTPNQCSDGGVDAKCNALIHAFCWEMCYSAPPL